MKIQVPLIVGVFVLSGCAPEPEPEELFSGIDLYLTYCASCHGNNGEGDGPVAGVMLVQVPNLRLLSERNDGTFPADAVAEYVDGRAVVSAHGDRRMPVWGDIFQWTGGDDPDTEQLVQQRISVIVDFVAGMQY